MVGGDGLSLSIAAASIIAKVTRDRIMRELAAEFLRYGWETKRRLRHRRTSERPRRIRRHTLHHCRSFRPIRELLEAAEGAI